MFQWTQPARMSQLVVFRRVCLEFHRSTFVGAETTRKLLKDRTVFVPEVIHLNTDEQRTLVVICSDQDFLATSPQTRYH